MGQNVMGNGVFRVYQNLSRDVDDVVEVNIYIFIWQLERRKEKKEGKRQE